MLMKTLLKFAMIVCCATLLPLLSAGAATVQVQVGADGLKFTPQDVTIQVGDTVQWIWAANGHSTTSGTPGLPNGIWDSGVQNTGFVFNQLFTTAGTFAYFCSPHGSCCAMIGSVTVNAPETIRVTRAQYTVARSQLTVQATDTVQTAVLTVSVTSSGEILGPMTNNGGGNYSAKFNGIANPMNITVTSDSGVSARARVRVR